MRHNPDIDTTLPPQEQSWTFKLLDAGNVLEAELAKLHRYHHGPDCPTCQALLTWWELNGR
jgi:hypothetical protein